MNKIIKESTKHKINKGAKTLWDFYSKKFDLNDDINEKKIIIFSLNFINDFLSGNLWNPELLAGKIYTDSKLKKVTYKNFANKHNQLNSLILEILDIGWMEETMSEEEYKEYLDELRIRLQDLIEYYENYLDNKRPQ